MSSVKLIRYLNRSLEYLFYALFLLVPLVFAGNTSELFEFNKMWITFGIAIAVCFLWFSKMIILRRLVFRRTVFDIPIALFLISQVVSTILTLDPHISLWGYYSRWNGGLLSTITYIFLFYAFVSNFFAGGKSDSPQNPSGETVVKHSLLVSLVSGFIVVLWSIPSHFGFDPTCLVFRGTFDVSCWTNDFQPRVRIFGPLGQPDWLAGYLGVLLPIAAAYVLNQLRKSKKLLSPRLIFYSLLFILFYISLLYSGSRSGIAATIISLIIFALGYIFLNRKSLEVVKNKFIYGLVGIIILVSFIIGTQLPIVNKFSWAEIQLHLQKTPTAQNSSQTPQAKTPTQPSQDTPTSNIPLGGSSSLQIRKIVWRGAISAWKANPIIGTGVETFAFAYYKYRPVEHNSVSEWNFLYNKAHNEYLNYLVTTGAFGLISYIFFVGLVLSLAGINLLKIRVKPIKYLGSLSAEREWDSKDPLILALASSFLAILIINFFGFSVVIMNIYLFLIPVFILILLDLIPHMKEAPLPKIPYVSYGQWAGVTVLGIAGIFMIGFLVKFWIADTKYALGFNYNQAGEYQSAYPLLQNAVKLRREPVFLNEMAVNDANLAIGLAAQGSTESAAFIQNLATEALDTTDKLTKDYPHNLIFWKTKVRILYTLARLDPAFYPQALSAVQIAAKLAPTDASVLYNLGVLYGQNGDSKKAVETLEKTVAYRPHYPEAHFALGLFYHDLAVEAKSGKIKDAALHKKAINELNYILENLNPNDQQTKEYLQIWSKEK